MRHRTEAYASVVGPRTTGLVEQSRSPALPPLSRPDVSRRKACGPRPAAARGSPGRSGGGGGRAAGARGGIVVRSGRPRAGGWAPGVGGRVGMGKTFIAGPGCGRAGPRPMTEDGEHGKAGGGPCSTFLCSCSTDRRPCFLYPLYSRQAPWPLPEATRPSFAYFFPHSPLKDSHPPLRSPASAKDSPPPLRPSAFVPCILDRTARLW